MRKGSSLFFNVVLNLVLALVIYFNAQLGRMLGLEAEILPVSLVWLPTGLSLAALLLFGSIAWPGILLGNLAHNLQQLYIPHEVATLVGALTISLGSLLQALVAYKIMQRWCTSAYFNTVRDVLIFLFPAGIISCLIAPTVGVLTVNALSEFNLETLKSLWVTFWIGDTFGVYLLTPVLVVWTRLRPLGWTRESKIEVLLMILAFISITFLINYYSYPVYHFFILLNIWVAYRFGLRGVTLALFLIGLSIIIPFSLGFGFFNIGFIPHPLLAIVLFLEVLVCISLIVGAIARERYIAKEELAKLNINLRQCVESRNAEMEFSKGETTIKSKLYSIGYIIQGLIHLLEIPMKRINIFARNSLGLLDKVDEAKYSTLKNYLEEIAISENKGYEIIKAIKRQMTVSADQVLKARRADLSQILQSSVDKALSESHRKYPTFSFVMNEEFDRSIQIVTPVSEHLSEAIATFLLIRIQMMKEKLDHQEYLPQITIKTVDLGNHIEVVIEDNGKPITPDQLTPAQAKQTIEDLDITLAHDTLVFLYQGTIEAHTEEKGLSLITILFPKA